MSGRLGKRPASPPPRYQTKEVPLDGGVEATAGLATHPATLPGDRSNGAGPAVDPEPVPMALLLPTPDGKKMKWTLVDDDTPPETRLAAVASISKKLMPTPINSDSKPVDATAVSPPPPRPARPNYTPTIHTCSLPQP